MIPKTALVLITLLALFSCSKVVQQKEETTTSASENWKTEVENTIQLFGHRNWIVVADGAYPKQSNPAIKTITVDANQLEVVQFVNKVIKKSSHVQANIFLDKEMAFVAEKDAKGIDKYRTDLNKILESKKVQTMLHEDIIKELDSSAKVFDVLIIKTNLTIPYTSVFFQLDCGYWNAEAEQNLRTSLNSKK
ncbi:RbsD/FucU domain-containing protein [Flavobacterium sp.]|uniref:RbsD/FucU domain-containing protein n=1 Tax=Flavobacterium sp. TaxID=239 RepID=UPI00286DED79|nr:RbsD/FucU domain-containing protein [Flavobacterium sp.]